ncbi:MAG: YihY family inner rane protein, partial [Marmoricola sp.]|nr:YihY family inner rane protein [Marmoricola sp.]
MTTARTVPVTTEMGGEELDAEDAWHVVRRLGVRRLLVDAFVRFRYGDGFSSSRALALQAALAVVPFILALTGLVADLDHERPARVLARMVQAISPGSGTADALASAVRGSRSGNRAGEIALWVGL